MRFSCNYNKLLGHLQNVANVVEDSLSSEDDKNIIFQFKQTEEGQVVKLVGISLQVIFREELPTEDYDLTLGADEVDQNGFAYMQLKSKDLLAFLNSYKSVRRTKVNDVILEPANGKIKCTVTESPIVSDEELSLDPLAGDRTMFSQWMFSNIPIKPNKLPFINIAAPTEGLADFSTAAFRLYASCLLPIMENIQGLYGYMMFDANNVVAFNKAYISVMKNALASTGVFTDIRLGYRSIDFINKAICIADYVQVAKLEKHIFFKTAMSETFVTFDSKLAHYQNQLDLYGKDSCVKVDRMYLKDVLKRLSLNNDAIVVQIKPADGIINLSNSHFSQDIEIKGQFGMEGLDHIKFKIMPDVLSKAIIGDDDTFYREGDEETANTYLYYKAISDSKFSITFADSTDTWFSVAIIVPLR